MKNPVLLAVDDNEDNLFVLKQLINSNFPDCILFTANSAAKGLEIARDTRLDIVLTDVQMPEMSGIELCRHFKKSKSLSDIVIILVTAHHSTADLVAEGLEAGAIDFITKPIDNLELVARIRSAIRLKQAESKVKKYQQGLEQKVAERTASLMQANQRLNTEISEKEKAEKALKEINEMIFKVFEGTDEGLWDLDLKTGHVNYDSNWIEILGFDPEKTDFDHEWWKNQLDQESKSVVNKAFSDYINGKEKYYETEYRIKTASGDWKWVWSRGICLEYDEENKPLRLIGTQRDITEKRKAEEAINRLATAIEQVDESIVITDHREHILYVNPAFEQISGFTKNEVIGKTPRIMNSGVQPSRFYKEMWEKLKNGQVWRGNFVNKRKDGLLYNEEATISPVFDHKGNVCNYIAVKKDVTKRLLLEQQLRQAQKMEAIGTLAGGIAHDFNNILFAILGYNSLSQRLLGQEHPVFKHLEKLGQAADRAKNLVAQILTFSRQTEQSLKPISVQPVIKEALNLLRASIPSTIEVRKDISREGGMIRGDLTQMHQIIVNLATNAYHAMKEKGGVLTISSKTSSIDQGLGPEYKGLAPGEYVDIQVTDTGVGMDQKTIDRIFEPYFSTKEQGDGTGLGLSIVHGIITSYNGKVLVDSEIGVGTTFRILIPEIDEGMIEGAEDMEFEESNLLGKGEKIGVVDDEESITEMLKNMLEELGYKVEAFTGGDDVIKKLSEDPDKFDLVITDMTMPKLTGAELAVQLLKIRSELPIILCTGYSDTIDEEKAKEIGIKEFLMKPISLKKLANSVKKTLSKST